MPDQKHAPGLTNPKIALIGAAAFSQLIKNHDVYKLNTSAVVDIDPKLVECAKKDPIDLVPQEYHDFMHVVQP